ncbi:MAG: ParA family protein, partial [Erysipelotrichales bacterium]
LEDTLPVVYESTHKNVSFIPSRLELALTERKIMLEQNKAQHSRLFKAIKGIRKDFDYIVIDCPPILNLLTVNALNASNEIIIPIKIDKAAEKGFAITLSNITEIADSYDLELDYKVLFTMVNNTKIDKARMDQIIGNCKDNTINTRIRYQSKPVTEAGYKKVPVVEGNSNVGQDYKELCDELIATWTSCPGKKE